MIMNPAVNVLSGATKGTGAMAHYWLDRAHAAIVMVATGSSPKDVDPSTGKGPEWGKAAPIGLLVIVLLGVACYFLARSFSRNLRRVPPTFGDDTPGDSAGDIRGDSAGDTAERAPGVESSMGAPRGAADGPAGRAGTAGGPRRSPKTGKRR